LAFPEKTVLCSKVEHGKYSMESSEAMFQHGPLSG
jgi:hypothetical protein